MTEFAEGGSLADGRHTLERQLGAGGMAAVWLARDERLGRPAAIKVLSDTLAGQEGYVRRFRREARVAAGLSHPNLVRVFDSGHDPRPYLVMEYVAGGTLAEQRREAERELDCHGLVRGCWMRSIMCTRRASSTATSSPPTSSSARTGARG
jgi:serine/threonine protein kinase